MDMKYEEMCEQIDAAVFTGDFLRDRENIDRFSEYLARWQRAVNEADARDAHEFI